MAILKLMEEIYLPDCKFRISDHKLEIDLVKNILSIDVINSHFLNLFWLGHSLPDFSNYIQHIQNWYT